MQLWIAALFVGFLAIGLGRERTPRRSRRLILLVVIVVVGYAAAKIHAI